jgi:sugar O-acyltransferase (sialic acid O-acetyltransferase NeuD family)
LIDVVSHRILVFGAGGHAREILQLLHDLRDTGTPGSAWEPAGVLVDEGLASSDGVLKGVPVFAGEAAWPAPGDTPMVVAVGASIARERIVRRLVARGHRHFPVLVHPRAWVSSAARLGDGCVVFAGAMLNADVTLGSHVHVNLGCSISHDSVLDDFATLSPGVRVCGNGHVGEAADLGAGTVLIPHARVGARAIVGAGAVVVGEIPADVTAVGMPARVVKRGKG